MERVRAAVEDGHELVHEAEPDDAAAKEAHAMEQAGFTDVAANALHISKAEPRWHPWPPVQA